MPSDRVGKGMVKKAGATPGHLPRPTTAVLLGVTLAYLSIEAAFNARLVDVLGGIDMSEAHGAAINGLEFWGRFISAIAVGLAIGTIHVSQFYKGQAPAPIHFMFRGRPPMQWTWRYCQISVAICMFAMIATFVIERAIVEDNAERTSAEELWWAHYGARTSDAVALMIGRGLAKPEIRSEVEKALAERARKESIPGSPLQLADINNADSRTYLAILADSSRNWVQTMPQRRPDGKVVTPTMILTATRDYVRSQAAHSDPATTRAAVLAPVERCMELIYDQAPPYETAEPAFPLPPARCAVAESNIDTIRAAHPILARYDDRRCFYLPDGRQRAFADFVSLQCIYDAAIEDGRSEAERGAIIYNDVYARMRDDAIVQLRNNPSLLRPTDRAWLAQALRNDIDRTIGDRPIRFRDGLFDPASHSLPACNHVTDELIERFAIPFSRQSSINFLNGLERRHCDRFAELLPVMPDPTAQPAVRTYMPGFPKALNEALGEASIPSVDTNLDIMTTPDFATYLLQRVAAPVEQAANAVLARQFGMRGIGVDKLPSVATIRSLNAFFENPIISYRAARQLQDLTDSALMCVGLSARENSIPFSGSLASISASWDMQFHRDAMRLLTDRMFSTRLTGPVEDFRPNGRCRDAGIIAHHRTHMPTIVLIISLLGLLYHSRKAMLYGLSMCGIDGMRGQFGAAAGLALLCVAPLTVESKVLNDPDLAKLIDAYAPSRGQAYADGLRWLIRAELMIHPVTNGIQDSVFRPWGIGFARPIESRVLNADTISVNRACARVPQIAQSEEYHMVRTILTHRSLCNVE